MAAARGFIFVTGKALGLSPPIGILTPVGVAAENSILLVEYTPAARKERDLSRFEALLDAARNLGRLLVERSDAQAATATPAKDHPAHVYPV
ncbi:hypothetical protein ACFSOZ_15200 [Mesorhizobium newzealandense]|uniref:GAF domain-containing protein n=1 Tax=Mesorhizobium newzealandense TaxID=1300302 RepID=A0ABW4U8V4_9HYPH